MSADARTVAFEALLRDTAHRCGLDPEQLGASEAQAIAEHLTTAARKAHRHYDWPDIIRTEPRALRPVFDFAAIYPLGAEVYDPESDHYYQAILGNFSGLPVTDDAYWKPIATLRRAMPLLSAGDTPMAEILEITAEDPDTAPSPRRVGYRLSEAEVLLEPDEPANVVWVRFRLPPPRFSAAAWDPARLYQPGEIAFLAPHAWLCLTGSQGSGQAPASDSPRWRAQTVPELLEDAIKDRAKAEYLSAAGQDERAIALRREAREQLDDQTAQLTDHQSQSRTYAVRNRFTARRQLAPSRRP